MQPSPEGETRQRARILKPGPSVLQGTFNKGVSTEAAKATIRPLDRVLTGQRVDETVARNPRSCRTRRHLSIVDEPLQAAAARNAHPARIAASGKSSPSKRRIS